MDRKILASALISEGTTDPDDYWVEGEPCRIEVETTDEDEIRVGVMMRTETTESVGLYLSRSEAAKLATFLSAAVVSEVALLTE